MNMYQIRGICTSNRIFVESIFRPITFSARDVINILSLDVQLMSCLL